MIAPPPGYYRKLLSHSNIDVRIAFTSQPIINCTKIDNEEVLKDLKRSNNPYSEFYINGLENNSLVAIIPNNLLNNNNVNKVYSSEELYFKT